MKECDGYKSFENSMKSQARIQGATGVPPKMNRGYSASSTQALAKIMKVVKFRTRSKY